MPIKPTAPVIMAIIKVMQQNGDEMRHNCGLLMQPYSSDWTCSTASRLYVLVLRYQTQASQSNKLSSWKPDTNAHCTCSHSIKFSLSIVWFCPHSTNRDLFPLCV